MKETKKKITIKDLRADKGGDPDKYRKALSELSPAQDAASSADLVDQALHHDAERRALQATLEQLRHQVSELQTNVIAPGKKAGQEVPPETLAQVKQWKEDISKLGAEVKDREKKTTDFLKRLNELLENVVTDIKSPADQSSADGAGDKRAEEISTNNAATSGIQILKRQTPTKQESESKPQALPIISLEQIKTIPPERILNINVGVLGHVDTGKTSLVKTLSSVLSTAALDKSKQSRARGITLDLGFSAFLLPLPDHLKRESDNAGDCKSVNKNSDSQQPPQQTDSQLHQKYDLLQVTLVDCPGHASLIRTIIGGAQIIDMVLLVVDANKGMQTQTAECLVIAEMTTRNLIVVLNKVDLFPEHEREERIRLTEKKMRNALRGTKFEDAPMVGISACVGGEKVAAIGGSSGVDFSGSSSVTHNIHGLLEILQSQMRAPNRDTRPSPDRFHFAVDHCFPIKGQGTVLTGTCLSGKLMCHPM
jgi:small GTP-binding protein